ncbi:hypothetical protein DNTS_010996 [Danionella cerebrum]|uniref:Uncharacterized protein n=1 Tax=Danionella cerebrum TaxID=2873325 RepID=A0A553MNX9_9TELE|nr:hypothetical protein DNTS_010996 [Danionella translucida]
MLQKETPGTGDSPAGERRDSVGKSSGTGAEIWRFFVNRKSDDFRTMESDERRGEERRGEERRGEERRGEERRGEERRV